MGARQSNENGTASSGIKQKIYRPPDVRLKDRFASDPDEEEDYYEATVDKYDFLMVFRLAEVHVKTRILN